MSDAVYDDVIRTESQRVEMMVAIYESVDCVRNLDFRTETNTHQPPQQTDGWFYYHSSCYYISPEWKNWTECKRYCTERGADLIIINNEDEHNFIMKTVGNYEAWIGLIDTDVEGTWKWVDGSTLTSGFWLSGEPNGDRGENCVVSYSSGWNDYPCHLVLTCIYRLFPFVCEVHVPASLLPDFFAWILFRFSPFPGLVPGG
ncbi:C-type lectin domain family 17, member A-like [Labeo rohita]|uniref:C-type lectin domain family 17, member A-like n=1 Tax=Labeo rohita TaxID=84645 RepID=UPI0021E31F76|nr:C-type lectin domain family 17, member A-like [Labeo rohita]